MDHLVYVTFKTFILITIPVGTCITITEINNIHIKNKQTNNFNELGTNKSLVVHAQYRSSYIIEHFTISS